MSENYAIVATGGKQYRVRQGDLLDVEKLPYPEGYTITLDEVLLACVDGEVEVGNPTVEGAQVVATVLAHGRDRKKTVFKYKNKTRYRVKRGHRQPITSLEVTDIEV
jgi:large subunit ribosomal protein L21